MTNKILDTGRRVVQQAREKLLGDRGRSAVAKISGRANGVGRQAREKLLSDGNRAAVARVLGRAQRVGRNVRDQLLPKARESVRRSVDRLAKTIRR
jgi:hypothetical protein